MDGLEKGECQGYRLVSHFLVYCFSVGVREPERVIAGITNQRETTLCWARSTGKHLCNAIVWDDARTVSVVRQFEKKLDEEGIEVDDEDVPNGGLPIDGLKEDVELGTSTGEAAFSGKGDVVTNGGGAAGAVGKVMESLGFAGRGKQVNGKKRRKGKDGLVDV